MSNFGDTRHERPSNVDELLGSSLMSSLDKLDIIARKIFSGKIQGERRSKRRGVSVEFADYRQYAAGDDLRFIDWNVYARLDRLFMKIFIENILRAMMSSLSSDDIKDEPKSSSTLLGLSCLVSPKLDIVHLVIQHWDFFDQFINHING